jgi:neurotransmitter:Na+ symporter, NSS family
MTSAAAPSVHGSWSSRLSFLFATIGFSVGLGNIWRFPWLAGENGGGAFVLVYLICVLGLVVPLALAEFLIGRRGGLSPAASIARLAVAEGRNPGWRIGQQIAILSVFGIATFYCVIGGWTLAYSWKAASGELAGLDTVTSKTLFDSLLASIPQLAGWTALFLVATAAIVARGLNAGVERATGILMPILFLVIAALAVWALVAGDAKAGLTFLLAPDFLKINLSTWVAAIGQAFFSVGVGMAGLMLYGAYLPKSVRLPGVAATVALADTSVALLAGVAIFPFLFAQGLEPAAGPGLVFVVMPVAFQAVGPAAGFIAFLFFVLLAIAALTSIIGMLEVIAAIGAERGLRRAPLVWVTTGVTFLLSFLTIFSFNIWSAVHPLAAIPGFETRTWFDTIDWLTSNVGLTLSGLTTAIFAGWVMSSAAIADELGVSPASAGFRAYRFLLRYPIPAAVLALIIAAFTA